MLNINRRNETYCTQCTVHTSIAIQMENSILDFRNILDVNTMLHSTHLFNLLNSLFNGLNLWNGCENNFFGS